VKLDEHCAEVQLFIHTAYNSLISSLHLLVSGYPVGSGHLMRHFVESIAMALMCSDLRIGVYQAYAANRKHFDMASAPDRLKQKPVRRILESALGFDSDAWETVLHLAPHAQAPPNTRLKLTAPVVGGRIAFVIIPARRRSLSAIR